jgi:biphenyl-2,3-diol 1,2-dioxygenase
MAAVSQLGYLEFEVSDLAAWRRFGTEFLGLTIGQQFNDGGFALKMDEYEQRFFIRPGERDDLSVVGWEVEHEQDLVAVKQQVEGYGISVREGGDSLRERRRVQRIIAFEDPAGIPTEVYWGAFKPASTGVSACVESGYVAGQLGLGHVVLTTRVRAQSEAFYCEGLGLKLSDRIVCQLGPYEIDLCFLRANPRHHSLALGGPQTKRLHHFMIQVRELYDVGLALDRARNLGIPVVQSIGQHPNDKMISFYAVTPSGFQVEFGSGGLEIDSEAWKPQRHERVSQWGHRRPLG